MLGQEYVDDYTKGNDHILDYVGFSDPRGVTARFLWILKTAGSPTGWILEMADVRVYANPL